MSLIAFIPAGQINITVNGLHQWDYGQKLEIHDDTLPALIEVHFACPGMQEAVVTSCHTTDGVAIVDIPDQCLEQRAPVTAWIYEIGETSGTTIKTITLPIIARVKPPMLNMPQTASDKYAEAVAAMNEIVEKYKSGEIIVARAMHAQNAEENTERIIAIENQNQGYAQSFDELAQDMLALIDRVTALENNSGGTSGGTSDGSGSYSVVQVTIKNNSSVSLTGTYTNASNQSGTTFSIAASGSQTLSIVKGTVVRFNSVYGGSALAVKNSSYGYGPHTSGGYYFVASSTGSIEIVDPAFTVKVSYSGGNAILTWTSVTGAERYDVYADGYLIGSASGTTYTVTPADVLDPSSCECSVAATSSTGKTLAAGRVTISFT